METALETPSPGHLNQEGTSVMGSSPLFSPSSDKRFWSTLRGRIDTLLDDRHSKISKGEDLSSGDPSIHNQKNEQSKRLKEGSMLLIRGFDSVAHTLSLLSNNLDNALQGARQLGHPPTLTDIFQSNLNKAESKEDDLEKQQKEEESKKGIKRKFDPSDLSEDNADDSQKANEQRNRDRNLKKAKNLAVSMAAKAASLAREIKSVKSDLCFMQERCALLEEENGRLRDGFAKGMRPEEDDLVRLQLEALLAEKSRLANENANLIRENQCLHQLVEYHQVTTQDLSASYEQVIQGMCLDFSSPPPTNAEEERDEDGDGDGDDNDDKNKPFQTPRSDLFEFCTSLDESYNGDE